MANSEFFKQFKQNYKPKKLDLTPYLRSPKLKGYQLLTDKTKLVPMKTYIKYIKPGDVFEGIDWSSHIKAGGILLKGGYYADHQFHQLADPNEWTHLLLKFDPSPMEDEEGNIQERLDKPRIFTIKIDNYHVFYKTFSGNMRDFFKNVKIELKR